MKLKAKCFVLIAFLVSCSPKDSRWIPMQPQSTKAWMIGANSDFTKIWLGKPYIDSITEFDTRDLSNIQSREIGLPAGDGMSGFCPESSVAFSAKNNLYKYQEVSADWIKIYNSSESFRRCKVSSEGKVYFSEGSDRISWLNNDQVEHIVFSEGGIQDFALDQDDGIYVLSKSQKIYKYANPVWLEVYSLSDKGVSDGLSIFITSLDTVWIVSSYGLYQWTNIYEPNQASSLIMSYNRPIFNLHETKSGVVYIVAFSGLWELNKDSCNKVELPVDVKFIYSSVFNSKENILYVSTDQGLFFLDLVNIKYTDDGKLGMKCVEDGQLNNSSIPLSDGNLRGRSCLIGVKQSM